jgi:hypothetical protein
MTQQQSASIGDMVNQSKMVLTTPSVATFERYERSGNLVNAGIYIGIAAIIAAILGLSGGISGLIGSFLSTLANFFIFTSLVYYIGKQQGGTGTFDEVAYTFSLFIAPLSLVVPIIGLFVLIPVIGLLFVPILLIVVLIVLLVQAYFGYLAVQSSMNITDTTKSIITLGGAVIGTFIIQWLIQAIF